MLKRKALEGEKIIITNAQKGERDRCPFNNGDVLEVVASNVENNYVHVKPFAKIYDDEYITTEKQ